MAKTESRMLPLGTPAPKFSLPDTVSSTTVKFKDVAGARGTLVMFICNHCPFVKHILDGLVELGRDYGHDHGGDYGDNHGDNHGDTEIGMVAISSNDVTGYPQDRPERMKELAENLGFPFPYLYDETQNTARAYGAACTPDFFVFDGARQLVYRGQFDDSRPGNGRPVTGADLRGALDALLEGRPVPTDQRPSVGCSIKWKSG